MLKLLLRLVLCLYTYAVEPSNVGIGKAIKNITIAVEFMQ